MFQQQEEKKEERDLGPGGAAAAPGVLELTIPEDDIPREYVCPLSTDIMRNPVVAEDGITYEREAFEAQVAFHKEKGTKFISPIKREPFLTFDVRPNLPLKNIIEEFQKNYWKNKREKEMVLGELELLRLSHKEMEAFQETRGRAQDEIEAELEQEKRKRGSLENRLQALTLSSQSPFVQVSSPVTTPIAVASSSASSSASSGVAMVFSASAASSVTSSGSAAACVEQLQNEVKGGAEVEQKKKQEIAQQVVATKQKQLLKCFAGGLVTAAAVAGGVYLAFQGSDLSKEDVTKDEAAEEKERLESPHAAEEDSTEANEHLVKTVKFF